MYVAMGMNNVVTATLLHASKTWPLNKSQISKLRAVGAANWKVSQLSSLDVVDQWYE